MSNTNLWTPRNYERGEKIYKIGDVSSKIYRVVDGLVKEDYLTEDGRQFSIPHIRGDCFGLDGLSNNLRTSETFAIKKSVIEDLDVVNILEYFKTAPEEAYDLFREVAVRYTESNIIRQKMLYENVEDRVLSILRHISQGNGGVSVRMSDIGEFIGSTRETANKMVLSLLQRRMIAKIDGVIKVLED